MSAMIPLIYMSMEIFRAISTEAMFATSTNRLEPLHSSVILFLIEAVKLCISAFFVYLHGTKIQWSYLKLFVAHSCLYFINNSLYYYAFQFANAGAIQFLMHMRLPMTAFLHHVLIKKQTRWKPWAALGVLFMGVVLTQLNEDLSFGNAFVFLLCFLISVNSAMAAIYNEKLLKTLKMGFWEQQFCIYLLGCVWCSFYVMGTQEKLIRPTSELSVFFLVLVVAFGALSGLSVGFLIKRLDNIVKLIVNAVATVIIAISVFLLFGKSKTSVLAFTLGSSLVLIATWFYAQNTQKPTLKEDLELSPIAPIEKESTLDPIHLYKMILGIIALEIISMFFFNFFTIQTAAHEVLAGKHAT